jgi:hypothetical protein
MRVGGALLPVFLLVAGCSDAVTNVIIFSEVLGGETADVRGALPRSRDEMLSRVEKLGYQPSLQMERCAGRDGPDCDLNRSPVLARPVEKHVRLYFEKAIHWSEYSTAHYGLLVDVSNSGQILQAIGFKQYEIVF